VFLEVWVVVALVVAEAALEAAGALVAGATSFFWVLLLRLLLWDSLPLHQPPHSFYFLFVPFGKPPKYFHC
ncbi:hypothetical protein, partial [Eubacterium aggregans]|uniref:hypothetical protein n=1 Tax=Eubacterium aggregans TaxID=81409 RepID=UPI003F414D0B